MYNACKSRDDDLIELNLKFIKGDEKQLNYGLYGASESGNQSIVELMIEKGANDWNWGLCYACYGGHQSIVELMIEKGANDWHWGLRYACYGGHQSIVELMIKKGAHRCNYCKKSIEDHLL
jgi:ankyrin repeat protein